MDGHGVETCETGTAATDCTGGAGDGCVFALDCAARFALQASTTEPDCTGAVGAGCTYSVHNPVSYTRCSSAPAAELGFRSFYANAFSVSSGNPSAQSVGVVADSSSGSGQQVFEVYDVDGFAYGMLDVVPVSGFAAVHLSCYVYFSASTWETEDYAKIWVSAEAGGPADVVIMHTTGDNIDAGVENQWTEVTGSLGGLKTATVKFGAATSRTVSQADNDEAVRYDNIRILASGPRNGTAAELEQRAVWPAATVCPSPTQWMGAQKTEVAPPTDANSISLTLTATTDGWFDDVYATVDPRVACWCEEGFAWEAEYTAAAGGCLYCMAGSFCTAGIRQSCPAGLISRGGQSECEACPAGFTCAAGEKSSCQGLQYMDGNGDCQACPAGSACVNARRDLCQAGTWSDGTLNQCALCVPGQFTDSAEATGCTDCVAGQTSTVGNPDCFDCGAGETSVAGGPCASCPDGKYSTVGTNTCESCQAGKFNNRGAVAECEDCPTATPSSYADFTGCQ